MFFEKIEFAPADPILGLTEAFKKDENIDKINLSTGVYQDEFGNTPILKCVKEAEKLIYDKENSKSYLPITGLASFGTLTRELIFGKDSDLVNNQEAITCHCPGGTGALRVGADFIKQQNISSKIWISDPTWANHYQIVESAGLKFERFPYYDRKTRTLAFDKMMDTLSMANSGDVVLLHACCHNPTGIDPTYEQWCEIAKFLKEKKLLPFIDFAYQGFGLGLEEDAKGLRAIVDECKEVIIASSYSKNMGLYSERVGALTVVCQDKEQAKKVESQVKIAVRTSISNPPSHGELIVTTVLSDKNLRALWEEELYVMRTRIKDMRKLLATKLEASGAGNYNFILEQNGMFSFSGLTQAQVEALKEQFSIYIVGSGRICVACINENNVDKIVSAISSVINIEE